MFLQDSTNEKKPCELQTTHTPGKLAEARSMFGNGASEKSNISNKKEKLFPPAKPPRVVSTETNSEERPGEQQQAAKRKAPSPPKETKESSESNTTSVIKRKAPEPPTSNQEETKVNTDKSSNAVKINKVECQQKDTKARNTRSQGSSIDEEGDGSCTPVPAKRERKGSVDSLDGIIKAGEDQPTPKPRTKAQNSNEANTKIQEENANKKCKEQEAKGKGSVKKAKKTALDNTVTIVATPVDENRSKTDTSKQRPKEQPCVIQACVVEEKVPVVAAKSESSENTITVKAVSCSGSEVKSKSRTRGEKAKVTSVEKTEKHPRKAKPAEQVSNDVIPAVAMEKKPPSSSRKTRESTKKDDFAFKVPRKPTKEHCHFDPNETVNLNDVNIHEMTFSFDFGQFDQELEKEREESMFKLSYEEKCKQVGLIFHFVFSSIFYPTCTSNLIFAQF